MVHSLNFAWMSVVRSNQVAYLSSIKTPFRILTAGHSPGKNPNVRQKNHWSNWSFLSFRKGNIGKKGVNFSRYWPPIQLLTPLTQDVDWAYIRRSEGVLVVLWTSYVRGFYVLCSGGKYTKCDSQFFLKKESIFRVADISEHICANASVCDHTENV